MKRPIVLVDAMNQLFRAHYAHAALTTQDGYPTGGIYGFLEALLTVQKHFPDHPDVVICWEGDTSLGVPGKHTLPSWRKVIARSMYKANRVSSEETVRALAQLPRLYEILKVMGYLQVQVPQLEADDVIGVAAASLRHDISAGSVYIFSGDQDYYQCCESDRVQVLHPKQGKLVLVDARSVLLDHGVPVDQWAKFKALAGDTTDNYKALKGVGPKGAAKLLKAGVDPSLPHFHMLPASVQTAHKHLEPHWEKVYLCYRLAKIPTTWSAHEFPIDSRSFMRATVKEIILRRRRCMTEQQVKQAFAQITKILGELEMVTFLGLRSSFFHGVKVTK